MSWLFDCVTSLMEMQYLPKDWESGEADPPSELAIRNAMQALIFLSELDFPPKYVNPSTDEGVCISWRVGERYADIEFYNDGEILAAFVSSKTEIVPTKPEELKKVLESIKEFMSK